MVPASAPAPTMKYSIHHACGFSPRLVPHRPAGRPGPPSSRAPPGGSSWTPSRFDALVRLLGRAAPRRAALAFLLAAVNAVPAAAERRRPADRGDGGAGAEAPAPCTKLRKPCIKGAKCCSGFCKKQTPTAKCGKREGGKLVPTGLCRCAKKACAADCAGKQCGPDGCGGTCGTCPDGQSCDGAGQCTPGGCTPDNTAACGNRACGPATNNCGQVVSCGSCPTGQSCNGQGQCVPGPCEPDNGAACSGKQCGPATNNCGETVSCGTCLTGQSCDALGRCCTPNCFDRECGPDGCGGSSGACPLVGQVCDRGRCVCPADKSQVCGGACRAPCAAGLVRDPGTCGCCFEGTQTSGPPLEQSNCCSGLTYYGGCWGRGTGVACTFDGQCGTRNCIAGRCDGCRRADLGDQDFCYWGDSRGYNERCTGGLCYQTLSGRSRCGVKSNNVPCGGCASDQDCGEQLGDPATFCAVDTGNYCDCPNGQTFCAYPR